MPLELLMPNDTTIAALEEAHNRDLPRFDSVQVLMDDLLKQFGVP
jgi:antitoxin component of RelBE/YafQ-DinJ toxin-antitoxin module